MAPAIKPVARPISTRRMGFLLQSNALPNTAIAPKHAKSKIHNRAAHSHRHARPSNKGTAIATINELKVATIFIASASTRLRPHRGHAWHFLSLFYLLHHHHPLTPQRPVPVQLADFPEIEEAAHIRRTPTGTAMSCHQSFLFNRPHTSRPVQYPNTFLSHHSAPTPSAGRTSREASIDAHRSRFVNRLPHFCSLFPYHPHPSASLIPLKKQTVNFLRPKLYPPLKQIPRILHEP
jgi:hypothetical protein